MRNVEPIIILRGALKVYRRSPSPSRLTAPRGIAIFDKKTGCGCTRWALISQDCGYELTRGLVQQLRAATASIGVANSTKFRRHSSGSAVISSRDETLVLKRVQFPIEGYKQDLRPAQQEEEAWLAQGKLRRQLRTGRALVALGLSGGRMPAQGAVWHGIL